MGGLHPPIPAYPSMPVGSWPSPTPSGSLSFPLQVMGAKRSTSSLQSSTGWWAPKGSSARVCPPPLAGPGMKALLRLLSPDAPAPRGPRWVPVRRGLSQLAPGSPGQAPPLLAAEGGSGWGCPGACPPGALGPGPGPSSRAGRLSCRLPPCWSLLPREVAPSPDLLCPWSLLEASG